MEFIILFPFYLLLCILISSLAKKKGRNAIGYFFLAIIFSPFLALLFLLVAGESEKKKNKSSSDAYETKTEIACQNTDKYIQLEKLGLLLEKDIISKVEFDEEKKKILSPDEDTIKSEDEESSSLNSNEIEKFTKINNEIEKTKNNLWSKKNDQLLQILQNEFTNKEKAQYILNKYEKHFNTDLIEKLKNISTNFNTIEKYLTPFIELDIVEPHYPHEKIDK